VARFGAGRKPPALARQAKIKAKLSSAFDQKSNEKTRKRENEKTRKPENQKTRKPERVFTYAPSPCLLFFSVGLGPRRQGPRP